MFKYKKIKNNKDGVPRYEIQTEMFKKFYKDKDDFIYNMKLIGLNKVRSNDYDTMIIQSYNIESSIYNLTQSVLHSVSTIIADMTSDLIKRCYAYGSENPDSNSFLVMNSSKDTVMFKINNNLFSVDKEGSSEYVIMKCSNYLSIFKEFYNDYNNVLESYGQNTIISEEHIKRLGFVLDNNFKVYKKDYIHIYFSFSEIFMIYSKCERVNKTFTNISDARHIRIIDTSIKDFAKLIKEERDNFLL